MKSLALIIVLIFASEMAPAMSFWAALAEIESGHNDYAIGSVGEISRYQIRPEVWRAYSSSKRYADPAIALPIAEKYMAKLKRNFERATGRAATEADCVILWKSGIAGYEKRGFNPSRMSAAHHDRIARFDNLRMEGMTLVHAPPAAVPATPHAQMPADNRTEIFFLKPATTDKSVLPVLGESRETNLTDQTSGLFSKLEPLPGTAGGGRFSIQ